MLFSKGRSPIAGLITSTGLDPRQVRHGLAVLVQQGLAYTTPDSENKRAMYEANPDGCYNIMRAGKIVEMVGTEYGPAEQEVVQTIMQLGHAKVSDLAQAFASRDGAATNGKLTNGHTNGNARHPSFDLHAILNRLVVDEIVDQVGPKTFRNPEDIYREIEEEVTKTNPGEKTTARNKELMQTEVAKRLREAREESKKLKRQLGRGVMFSTKRRKLANGAGKKSEWDDDVPELEVRFLDSGYQFLPANKFPAVHCSQGQHREMSRGIAQSVACSACDGHLWRDYWPGLSHCPALVDTTNIPLPVRP